MHFFTNYLLWFYVKSIPKSLELQKLFQKLNLKEPGGEFEAKYCLRRQSWPKYFRQTLLFLWNSTLRGKFNFYFSRIFSYYWQNFNFGSKTEHQAKILSNFEIFFIFPNFLRLCGNLWGNSYIPRLLLIITIPSTCDETKILSNIKMSQNIMTRILA